MARTANYLYALNLGDQTVSVFSIDPFTGTLTLQSTSPDLGATSIAVNPAGTVLYAGGSIDEGSLSKLSSYTINPDGSINPAVVSSVTADVDGIAVSPDGTEVATAYPGEGKSTATPGIQLWSTDSVGHLTLESSATADCASDVKFGLTDSVLYGGTCCNGVLHSY